MYISHCLALIATQNGFSYLLSLGPNCEKSQVYQMTHKWPWTLQSQRYAICVALVPTSPRFHSVLLYDRSFSRWLRFLVSPQGTILSSKKIVTNRVYARSVMHVRSYNTPRTPKFHQFHSTNSHFQDICISYKVFLTMSAKFMKSKFVSRPSVSQLSLNLLHIFPSNLGC